MFFCQSVRHYDCFCKFAYSVIVSIALQFVFFCDYHAGCNSHKGVDGTRDTPPFRGTFTCPWNVSLLTPSHRYRTSQVSGAFFFLSLWYCESSRRLKRLKIFQKCVICRDLLFIQTVHEDILVLQSSQRSDYCCPADLFRTRAGIVKSLGYHQSYRTGYGACTFANPRNCTRVNFKEKCI